MDTENCVIEIGGYWIVEFLRFNGITLNYFQLLSLDDGQLGWVAKHLAHTIDTHKTY